MSTCESAGKENLCLVKRGAVRMANTSLSSGLNK